MSIAQSIRVTGHVQGVFFREWTVQVASQLGIAGWVRNRADGSVEIHAEGEPGELERFVAELRTGSPAARVDHLQIEPAELESPAGFLRRATV
jgi:acylphosphatase